ncbi:MAG: hypothetical protein H6728_12885 [Myxococcales bacterium]|nr:hypothetical protein [Myxococcales bacterium]MCB9643964.1 hypothetical protein [Myxococcales bacterium]
MRISGSFSHPPKPEDIPSHIETLRKLIQKLEAYRGWERSALQEVELPSPFLHAFSLECTELLCFQEEESGRPLSSHLLQVLDWKKRFLVGQVGPREKAPLQKFLKNYLREQHQRRERFESAAYYVQRMHGYVAQCLACLLEDNEEKMAMDISLAAQDYAGDAVKLPYADEFLEGKEKAARVLPRVSWGIGWMAYSDLRAKWDHAWSLDRQTLAARGDERRWQARLLMRQLAQGIQELHEHAEILSLWQKESEDALFAMGF